MFGWSRQAVTSLSCGLDVADIVHTLYMPIGPKEKVDQSKNKSHCQGGGAKAIMEMQIGVNKFIDV